LSVEIGAKKLFARAYVIRLSSLPGGFFYWRSVSPLELARWRLANVRCRHPAAIFVCGTWKIVQNLISGFWQFQRFTIEFTLLELLRHLLHFIGSLQHCHLHALLLAILVGVIPAQLQVKIFLELIFQVTVHHLFC
jgi:hypothetical protein